MIHSFFHFPSMVEVFILLFNFFQFYSVVSWDSRAHNFASSFLFILSYLFFFFIIIIIISSDRLVEIRWPVFMLKSHNYYYYYYSTPGESFIPALVGGISLESERQKIFSSHQDSSQYSSWSQHYYSLNDLDSSTDFQFLYSLLQTIMNRAKRTNYELFHSIFICLFFFSSLARSKYLSIYSLSFIFTLWSARTVKNTGWHVLHL